MGIQIRYTLTVHEVLTHREVDCSDIMQQFFEHDKNIEYILDQNGKSEETSSHCYEDVFKSFSIKVDPRYYLMLYSISEEGEHEVAYYYRGKVQFATVQRTFSLPNFKQFY